MKLHFLHIQAFGPFANKEVIDFSKLGESPLFLIDGPTGAGKSSILHAICYALYGETTDSERKGLGLRCDHADDDVLTELSLEFSIRGDRYRITRVPLQLRPAKRGDGETEQKPTAHLCQILDDGTADTIVPKKISHADDEIERIVGLTAAQFLQVMVLPQGKFRELLLAKSDDRQAILSKLFQTEIYKIIEQLLKDKAGSIERQNKEFEEKKEEALFEVNVQDIEDFAAAIEMAEEISSERQEEKERASTQKQKAVNQLEAAEALGKSFESRRNKQEELDDNLSRTDEINASKNRIKRAEKALSISPKWEALQAVLVKIQDKDGEVTQTESDSKEADLRLKNADKGMANANKLYKKRDPLKAKEIELEAYQKKLLGFEPLKVASLKADDDYQTALDKKAELDEENSEIDEVLKELVAEIENLSSAVSHKSEVVEQKLTAKFRYEQRDKLERAQKTVLQLNADHETTKQGFEQADRDYQRAKEEANRVEMLWFTNQAAVLASKLEENQPCVVCGSLEHPNPAEFLSGSADITQEVVDEARNEESESRNAMDVAKSALSDNQRSVDDKQTEIKGIQKELAEDANKDVSVVKGIYTKLESELSAIEEKEEQLINTKKLQSDKEAAKKPVIAALKRLDETLPTLNTAKANANNKLNQASKELPEEYRDAQIIEQAILDNQNEIQSLDSNREKANKEQIDASAHQSAMLAKLKQLKKDLKGLKGSKQTISLSWKKALAGSNFATQQEFDNAQLPEERLNILRHEIQEHDDGIKALNAELGLLDKQLKGKKAPVLDKLQNQANELTEAFNVSEAKWLQAQQQNTRLGDTQTKIKNLEKQQGDIKKQYEIVGALSKAASGRGNVRVSLERFVLGNILDSVLSIASQRLHTMSQGQYQLVRQNEEDQKRNTTAGLDLAIDDAYTGKTRPVATLSGGESFMASLALALALSDVVQERSGGIQLDTLFIDEGFGSLDQESLQLAINTLVDLQATGRTIGIISHVSELKEQMAQRIEVMGSRDGSTINMVALAE